MKDILKARIGSKLFSRRDTESDWVEERFPSIAAAKRANGLDSVTFEKQHELPKKQEKA